MQVSVDFNDDTFYYFSFIPLENVKIKIISFVSASKCRVTNHCLHINLQCPQQIELEINLRKLIIPS